MKLHSVRGFGLTDLIELDIDVIGRYSLRPRREQKCFLKRIVSFDNIFPVLYFCHRVYSYYI